MSIEFQPWPKIARLNRDMVITEKIDGTNAAVGIVPLSEMDRIVGRGDDGRDLLFDNDGRHVIARPICDGVEYAVYAQSRKKLITPQADNAGFARWVSEHAEALASVLGPGLHFGEWWGSGIQRGYGLTKGEKRFSLFNTPRYGDPEKFDLSPLKEIGVDTVPVLHEGLFDQDTINYCLSVLRERGSWAAPGFMNPEGIIVFHVAAQMPFKVTLVGDEKPKGSRE